mmetsp:Transcript_97839/g.281501  ORF Transcript_97839/g.281501 Transcript_97839/m.281501 type:complete len:215 (-) Transcript_97839:2156-2800(-)
MASMPACTARQAHLGCTLSAKTTAGAPSNAGAAKGPPSDLQEGWARGFVLNAPIAQHRRQREAVELDLRAEAPQDEQLVVEAGDPRPRQLPRQPPLPDGPAVPHVERLDGAVAPVQGQHEALGRHVQLAFRQSLAVLNRLVRDQDGAVGHVPAQADDAAHACAREHAALVVEAEAPAALTHGLPRDVLQALAVHRDGRHALRWLAPIQALLRLL